MARARNIKPGFFTNDDLVELPFATRLLFIGLWTIADRSGRMLDRPKKIKMDIFPGDDVDVDAALNELAHRGFILRYKAGDFPAIQICNWEKHQNPHVKEAKSTILAPGQVRLNPEEAQVEHGASTVQAPESGVQASEIPERAGLIPDSGFRIPDTRDNAPSGAVGCAFPDESAKPSKTKAAKPSDADLFPQVDAQVVADFKALRNKLRAPVTPTAMAEITKQAEVAGMSLEAALRVCCSRGWRGFKAEWVQRDALLGSSAQPNDKFHVRHLDHSSSNAAAEASRRRHGIVIPEGDVEISFD